MLNEKGPTTWQPGRRSVLLAPLPPTRSAREKESLCENGHRHTIGGIQYDDNQTKKRRVDARKPVS